MSKRKIFLPNGSGLSRVEFIHQNQDCGSKNGNSTPPQQTKVLFGQNATNYRSFDFAPWYGVGIDSITYECQKQIQRFLDKMDVDVEVSSVTSYCHSGMRYFLDFMMLRATALAEDLSFSDLNRETIDSYLVHLSRTALASGSQKNVYNRTKSVLLALGKRGVLQLITDGEMSTFPKNSFPNSNRKASSMSPLPKQQRQAFSLAVRQAVMPIWDKDVVVSSSLLAYVILIIALHTGRNTTPILEMGRDCLHPHPKENTSFLVLWKRRGHNTSKVALRADNPVDRLHESTPSIKANVELLIRRVIELTEPLRVEAPDHLKERVWLHRTSTGPSAGEIVLMSNGTLERSIKNLVTKYQLVDTDKNPLQLNISRLRKTFANRVFEILDGDLATTAVALSNTPTITERNYLVPGENAKRNWKFMGEVLVQELLNSAIGNTYNPTPMGKCSDAQNGQYAPKKDGAVCFSFLNCVRCKNYVVTADDLHKLFSFYNRVYAERSRLGKRRWKREYSHIPRLIDNYIVAEGLRRGIFRHEAIEKARELALLSPHPFWSADMVDALEVFL